MQESKLFESIIEMSTMNDDILKTKDDVFKDAPAPGFDLKDGFYNLNGKYVKFYKPDMTYDMENDHIVPKENILKNRY